MSKEERLKGATMILVIMALCMLVSWKAFAVFTGWGLLISLADIAEAVKKNRE